MHYEIVFKGDGCCSCYTCIPQTATAAQTTLKTVATPGTGTPPKDQCLLMIATPKQGPAHTHTCKQKANAKKQYNNA